MSDKTTQLGICDATNSITMPGHSWAIPNDPNDSVRECYACGVVVEGHRDFYGFFGADRVLGVK